MKNEDSNQAAPLTDTENPPINPPPATDTTQPKSPKGLIIILVILVLILASTTAYFTYKSTNKPTSNINQSQSNTQNTTAPNPTSIPPTQAPESTNTLQDLEDILMEVNSGNISYEPFGADNKASVYKSELLKLPNYQIDAYAFKYTPGLIYQGGYEGFRWDVDMDKWVDYLQRLEEGSQELQTYGDSGEGQVSTVIAMKINDNIFEISDIYFQPSASWKRQYVTYDEQNNHILIINITDLQAANKTNPPQYSTEIQSELSTIETILKQ